MESQRFTSDVELIAPSFGLPGIYLGDGQSQQFSKPDGPQEIFHEPPEVLDEVRKANSNHGGTGRSLLKTQQEAVEHEELNFLDIVHVDFDEAFENYVSEELVGRLVEGLPFKLTIIFVIVLNSVLIGMQTDKELERQMSGVLSTIDTIFLTIFVVEILLKWFYGFVAFWKIGWNVFDFLIVAASLLGPSLTFLSSGRVVGVLRVVRAFRTLRSISALQSLQVIVQTIIQSLPDMINILVLLAISMFIFAVVGVTVFGDAVPQYFGAMDSAMFTLFIMVTQDGWVSVFRVMEEQGLFLPAAIYFSFFITVGAFILINVFVGVVVTNLQVAYEDMKRMRKEKYRKLADEYEGQGGHVHRKVVNLKDLPDKAWSSQTPLELPDLSHIPPSSLETYFLVMLAIEENLAEFATLRHTLHEVFDDISELNRALDYESDQSSSDEEVYEFDPAKDTKGDVISQMMRRNAIEREVDRTQQQRRGKRRTGVEP